MPPSDLAPAGVRLRVGSVARDPGTEARAWVRELVTELGAPWRGFAEVPRGTKPLLADGPPGWDIGIAHSGPWVVAGVAQSGRLGVDIEAVAPVFDQPALVRRLCSPAERETIDRMDAATRRIRLTRLWTIKESFAKALGVGLALDFTTIEADTLGEQSGLRSVRTASLDGGRVMIAVTWVDDAPLSMPIRMRAAA
ncbi:4'-phosphopantetheinyl transferase family protein [Microbacterium hominis]|uniref:4'-phosphopantetheinyl transferase superfamily protein n=1 Tax=Microbacterium hominis TaxID=162426 RepID=A0A7D4QK84_9MICO|nr:4'-phosphopantetheinyl transferase superfamily protein [Microbacterium hominis]QKJ20296.1 4'-phosphopantetheinyl transferase superfamily protein [Microbacterium hominis]